MDPHHFNADPYPAFHYNADTDQAFYFSANPDPAPHQVIGICDHWSIDPPGLHFESPGLHCKRPRPFMALFDSI